MMLAVSTKKEASYQDILDLPENMVGELIDGELYAHARPAPPHAWTATTLGSLLGPPFSLGRGGPGGWTILFEPELHFGARPDVLVPDFAGWRRTRMPEVPGAVGITLHPRTGSARSSRPRPRRSIAPRSSGSTPARGVSHVWLIDPDRRTLEVLRLESGRCSLLAVHADEALVRVEPFELLELELGLLFAP